MVENDYRELRPQAQTAWPIWLFFAGCLCLNVVIPAVLESITQGSDTWPRVMVFTGLVGAIAGQGCFVVVLAALSRRTWLGGFLLGVLLATAGVGSVVLGLILTGELADEAIYALGAVGFVPAFLLSAASPLYACRQLFGWRLEHAGTARQPRSPLGLDGVFSLITVVATVIVLLRAPQVLWEAELDDFWATVLIFCVSLFAAGLIVLPIFVRFGLDQRKANVSVGVLGGFSIAIILVTLGIVEFLQATLNPRLKVLPYIFGFVASTTGVLYFSLWLLRRTGFELVQEQRQTPTDEQQAALRSQRRNTRWRIVAAIGLTMAVSVGLARLQSWRAMTDERNLGLRQYAEGTDGSMSISHRRVIHLFLGEKARDGSLGLYKGCSKLRRLHFVKSPVTDAELAELKHFPMLRTLEVVGTKVTDAGLVHLQGLPQLESLSLVGDGITGSGLVHVSNKSSLDSLALVETEFSDDECDVLSSFPNLRNLNVSSTQVTDRSLQQLGNLRHLNRLTANETNITARDFPYLPNLGILSLRESQVDDEGVASLIRLDSLWNLDLRNTRITNAALKDLSKLPALMFIDVSGNDIDDAGVRHLRDHANLKGIFLNDTRVTGKAFAGWNATAPLGQLSLDRTAFDDAGVKELVKLKPFTRLSLVATKVTDACLADIAKMGIEKLDLSGTRVTVKGIRANGMRSVGELTLSAKQLQGTDRKLLEKQLGIDVHLQESEEGPAPP